MISSDSRYASSANTPLIFKAWNAQKQQYDLTVLRNWPSYSSKFFVYQWAQGDRLDNIANRFPSVSSPQLWWQIMDLNPEILNPFTISPGTLIRIPNA